MTFPLLDEWLPDNAQLERPQMILSTASPDGGPDARTVLLTEFDDEGLYFHTDSRSRKVAELAANPAVALTFLWPNFTRQLVVRGLASVAPQAEQERAFSRRSPYLKQLAWQNSPEFAQLPLSDRVAQWSSFDVPDQPPATWIGFVVRPSRLTFWQSSPETASRRDEYTLVDGEWVLGHLPG